MGCTSLIENLCEMKPNNFSSMDCIINLTQILNCVQKNFGLAKIYLLTNVLALCDVATGIGQLLSPVIPVSTVPPLVHHGNPAPINLMPMSEVCRHHLLFSTHMIIVLSAGLIIIIMKVVLCKYFSFIVDNVMSISSILSDSV